MEHKQNLQPALRYDIAAFLDGPEPNEERLFTYNELEQLDDEIAAYQQAGWLKAALRRTDGPSLDELKHYRHRLNSYLNSLERYRVALAEGIVPIRVVVTNTAQQPDHRIRVEVQLHDGTFLLTRQPPSRPLRPLGPQQMAAEPSFTPANVVSGFLRSDIRLGRTKLAAQFSELGPGEEAAVVNQPVFLHCNPQTRMTYRLASPDAGEFTGEIVL